jgi:hypothetical protein
MLCLLSLAHGSDSIQLFRVVAMRTNGETMVVLKYLRLCDGFSFKEGRFLWLLTGPLGRLVIL